MAYPASTKTLQAWVRDIDNMALGVKAVALAQITASNASTLNMQEIANFFNHLVRANNFFITCASVTGLTTYLADEKQGVPDPVAELTAVRNAIVATLDWLRANVPEGTFSGSTYKLAFNFPAGNTTESSLLTFTAAQTAGYRTVLNTLAGTIG